MSTALHARTEVAVTAPRRLSRAARLTLAFLAGTMLVGLAATLYALLRASPEHPYPPALVLVAGVPVALAAAASLGLRFLRWQYLLRRVGVRHPAVGSLGAYVGSFAFLPVPLYLGQLVARVRLVPDLEPAARGRVVFAFLLERALDAWALALLATPAMSPGTALVVIAVAAAVFLPAVRPMLVRAAGALAEWVGRVLVDASIPIPRAAVERAASLRVAGNAALVSLAAWALVALAVLPLIAAAGARVPLAPAIGAGALGMLAGGLTLIPLGAGTAGLVLIDRLGELGADPIAAAHVTFVFRVATVWFSVAIGAVALAALRRRRPVTEADHFDAIDECYDAWLPTHYRDHLVLKKTKPIMARLGALGARPRGLDIGCGRGWYASALEEGGAEMTGLDTSRRQLVAAAERLRRASLVQASVLALPFRPAVFDFAYVINVLHHVPSPAHQQHALAEIARVVRPGGLVFVHEMSVRNPLFRIYLSYVFPILKGIDEGVEYYLDPRTLGAVPGLELSAVDFFTFVPDFVPARLLPLLEPIERRLETSAVRSWAAHFLAIYTRT